jgi:enamine deaminase RidA (YjgF/YER057c/UK114 family)
MSNAPNATHRRLSTNTPWETIAGFSRAVRVGNMVSVSGTTASDEQGRTMHPGDARGQTLFVLERIRASLEAAGAQLHDVVRTRIYIVSYDHWEEVALAHGEVFGDIRPANSLVVVCSLIPADALVEIEADAVVSA